MNPEDGPNLSREEAGAILRLLGDVAFAPGGVAEKRRLLMTGLAALIDADSWTWAYSQPLRAGEAPRMVIKSYDGFSEEQMAHYTLLPEHPQVGEISAPFFAELAERKTHLTRTQPQLDPEDRFRGLEVSRIFEKAGIGVVMLSQRPLPDGSNSILSIYRRPGRPHFGAREARIAHILLTEADRLHREGWSEADTLLASRLSSRERMVLNLAVDGRDRESIAGALGLSVHTVNDYLKAVYRKCGVRSQTQLIRRFSAGDGGDR